MTGTWRDTLFVWNGDFKLSDKGKEDEDSSVSAEWTGTWIGCEECPDARTAATPTETAFASSDMKFQVQGVIQATKKLLEVEGTQQPFCVASMSKGSGWDLAGDDGNIARYSDHVHEIIFQSPKKEGDDESNTSVIVVAKGENDFGAFISCGKRYPVSGNQNSFRLILARRYLDHRDERAKWDIEKLYTSILSELSQSESSIAPWHCSSLHAEKRQRTRGKRKRASQESK